MVFKSFRISIILRIVLLFITLFLLLFFVYPRTYLYTSLLFSVLALFQLISLFRYLDRFNKSLVDLLNSINYSDFTITFSRKSGEKELETLYHSMNNVIAIFKKARSEKEAKAHFVESVLDHLGVAIIVFSADGTVEIFNAAARKLLQIKRPFNIQALMAIDLELVNRLFDARTDESFTLQVNAGQRQLQLAISVRLFRTGTREVKMVSLQNISDQLEQVELETWQNLIKVLTHEIMNSITPITSLAGTANQIITETAADAVLHSEDREDLLDALSTIEKRSQGLLSFVGAFRNISQLPPPNISSFALEELFSHVSRLVKKKAGELNIDFSYEILPGRDLNIRADYEMLEQVLLNLLFNSIDSLAETGDPRIRLKAFLDDTGHIIITVTDNGTGIPREELGKIFIPFFTTKKTGTGIGLSLSRQIMSLHGGNIFAESKPAVETVFTLRF
jgi:two-component system nitrogen regulation sensor histidine kinase NtrY